MTTEQDTKDARQITIVIFMAIAAILILAYGWPYIFGQVEVKQSVTTNTNGQKTSLHETCNGWPKNCTSSYFVQLNGTTIELNHEHQAHFIHYCKQKCHTYRIADNGTIRKVN
jgi:hypothetical protein